jgi:cell division septum initiation protein DivIVA
LYVLGTNDFLRRERSRLKSKQAEDVILLKQKVIHLQSELARYKSKLHEYEQNHLRRDYVALKTENKRFKDELEQMEAKLRELTKKLEETTAENVILKELASQSEQRYEELTQAKREKEELQRQLTELKKYIETEQNEEGSPDSWFIRTLKEQNAIIAPSSTKSQVNVNHQLESNPFTFGGSSEEETE